MRAFCCSVNPRDPSEMAISFEDGSIQIRRNKAASLCRVAHNTHSGQETLRVKWSHNGEWLVSGGSDALLKLWTCELTPKAAISMGKAREEDQEVYACWFEQGNGRVCASIDNRLKCFELELGEVVWTCCTGHNIALQGPRNEKYINYIFDAHAQTCAMHPVVALACMDGSLRFVESRCGETVLNSVPAHDRPTTSCRFSRGNAHALVTSSTDGTVKVWDLRNLENCISTTPVHGSTVYGADFLTCDDQEVVFSFANKSLFTWKEGEVFKETSLDFLPLYTDHVEDHLLVCGEACHDHNDHGCHTHDHAHAHAHYGGLPVCHLEAHMLAQHHPRGEAVSLRQTATTAF